MSFNNKVVWITGASSGIGKALAIELSHQKATLILSSRNKAELELVKSECKNSSEVKIITLDLEDYTNLQPKVDEAIACFNRIDILVNNGGISQRSLVKDTQISVDKRIMDINYLGTVALSKAILPHFIKNKSGQFVVTTSIVGKIGTPLRSSYAASKHALHGFFDSLRAENHKNNIAVTLVCPGFVNTNVSKNALIGDGSSQGKMDVATENGIQPDDFAKLMAKAIRKKKEEVYIAGAKEKVRYFCKTLFSKVIIYNDSKVKRHLDSFNSINFYSLKEIETREDVSILVNTFYDKVRKNDLLGPIFNSHIPEEKWPEHLEKLTDFWETNLFGIPKFKGNPSQKHLNVDENLDYKVDQNHFGKWLEIWFETINELYEGDLANRAKEASRRIAHAQFMMMWNHRP